MPFETTLQVEEASDRTWLLTAPLRYQGKFEEFVVPAGFTTDFATVPRLLTWLVPTAGKYTKAAVLHDWLLGQADITRCDADGIFRRTMRELGVSPLRRYVMWAAVRLAGGIGSCGAKDLARVAGLVLFVLPVALPGTVLVLAGLGAMWLVEAGVAGVAYFLRRTPRAPSFWWS